MPDSVRGVLLASGKCFLVQYSKFPSLFLVWCFVPGPLDYNSRFPLCFPSPVSTKFPSPGTVCSWFWCVFIVLLIPGSLWDVTHSLELSFLICSWFWCFVPGPLDYDPRSTLSCLSPVFTKFPSSLLCVPGSGVLLLVLLLMISVSLWVVTHSL